MQKLQKYSYNDIKDLDHNFDPNDLIDDNDEEDNIYLAEYDLQKDRKMREEAKNAKNKKIELYGR